MAARKTCPAQEGITNVGFKDCRKFWTRWWRSPTGKSYEHASDTKFRVLTDLWCQAQIPCSLMLKGEEARRGDSEDCRRPPNLGMQDRSGRGSELASRNHSW